MEQIDRFEITTGARNVTNMEGESYIYDNKKKRVICKLNLKYKEHELKLAEIIIGIIGEYFEEHDGVDGEEL